MLGLAYEGRLDLDAPVEEYVPDFAGFGTRPTVRDLLTQTSGLTGRAAFAVSDHYGPDAADTAERVRRLADSTVGDPDTHEYSSANYLLLGAVIEEVTGDTDAYLRASVLDPAGMDSAFTGSAEAGAAGLSPGHRTLWGVPVADADGVDDAGTAYGYLGGDLTDLAAFARLQLNTDPAGLDADALARMRTGSVPVPGARSSTGSAGARRVCPGRTRRSSSTGARRPGTRRCSSCCPTRSGRSSSRRTTTTCCATTRSRASRSAWPACSSAPNRTPRPAATAAWIALGLGSVGAAAWLLSYLGPHGALTWVPDTAIALLAAAVLGTAVTAVRLTRHLRPAPR